MLNQFLLLSVACTAAAINTQVIREVNCHHIYTGSFTMICVITNIYNKKTKGPNLMEYFTDSGKLKKFFFFWGGGGGEEVFFFLPRGGGPLLISCYNF